MCKGFLNVEILGTQYDQFNPGGASHAMPAN